LPACTVAVRTGVVGTVGVLAGAVGGVLGAGVLSAGALDGGLDTGGVEGPAVDRVPGAP